MYNTVKYCSSILLTVLFIYGGNIYSQDVPAPPDPPRLVVDNTGILTASQIQELENRLVDFDRSSSTQIVALMVPSLNGLTIEEFADRIGEKWGVGQKGRDNGIVIVIKPRTENERGGARISVGYGLEEVVSDVVANRIVDRIMIPYFKENKYYEGLSEGVNVIIDLTNGVYTSEGVRKVRKQDYSLIPFLFILFIIFFLIIRSRNSSRYYSIGRTPGTGFLTGMLLGSMMSHRGRSSSWSSFNSGSGSFGGGGGFGGFGGGSFGGGGASGSW